MPGRIVRRGVLFGLGAVWWWAVVRLAVAPGAGALEGTVAAGGWGLSLLPVHCVAKARAVGAVETGRWRNAWRGPGAVAVGGPGAAAAGAIGAAGITEGAIGVVEGATRAAEGVTRASPLRRSGGGSDPS